MKQFKLAHAFILVGLALCPAAFAQTAGDSTAPVPPAENPAVTPPANPAATTPAAGAQVLPDTPNPLGSSTDAVAAGKALFEKMNCAGCHGYDLKGGMGPDLTDQDWTYGGKPGEIFTSISEGTPVGMPKWNDKLTPTEIWQLVSYILSKAGQ
jgi:mono/diheme cytochrome c family protein